MDILAALESLEIEERKRAPKKKKPSSTAKKYVNPLTKSNSTKPPPRQGRSQARAEASGSGGDLLSPPGTAPRSPSASSGRRISFADTPRPPPAARRLRIPTRTNSLASGFPYDNKLNKYGVSENQWNDFSNAVIERAGLPRGATWAWSFHKKDIIRKIRKELQYEGGELKRVLNAWNRLFKKAGFQASLELPGPPRGNYNPNPEDPEEAKQLELEMKRFKIVITPNAEKGGSVYSRSSSLARSVREDEKKVKDKAAHESEEEVDPEADKDKEGE